MIQASRTTSTRSYRMGLFCGVAALVAFIIGLALFTLKQLHDEVGRRVKSSSLVLAKSLEQTLQGQLDAVNLVLQVSASEISRQHSRRALNPQSISDFLDAQRKTFGKVEILRATNARGDVISGIDDLSTPLNISDRGYFTSLRDDPKAVMLINTPLISRTSKQWIWVFARRINAPDGSFLGIVYGAKTVESINQLFTQLGLRESNLISLRDADKQLIAQYIAPDRYFSPGDNDAMEPSQEMALKDNPDEGHYSCSESHIDGIARDHVYRRNTHYGFLVDVGINRRVAYSAWRQQAVLIGGFSLASIFVLMVSVFHISRGWRRQEASLDALATSQAMLEDAQKIASISSYSYDLQTDNWNGTGAIREILGIEPDFPTDSQGWLSLIAPEYREKLRLRLNAAVEQGVPFNEEYPVISRKNGQVHWLHHRAAVQADLDGKPTLIFGALQDITERKRTEDALRDGNEILQSILSTTLDGVWRLDGQGKIIDVNQACCEMTGYSREELLRMRVSEVDAMRSAQDVLDRIQYVAENGQALFDTRLRRKDGSFVDVEVSASYRNIRGGQVVAFMRDITERKRIEEELQRMATTDGLTGVLNRRHFMLLAEREYARALRMKLEMAVVLIDIDHFKEINDHYGHAAGDQAILALVDVFKVSIRQIDVFARLGGDEFVLLLPGSTTEQAVHVLKRVQLALQLCQVDSAEGSFAVTISAGVTSLLSENDSLSGMLERADQALYEAKESGRNCISWL